MERPGATWFVKPLHERPDFRLVIAFLWGDLHNIDSDGDSDNPASRSWTWLYLRSRERAGERVDLDMEEGTEACMRIRSEEPWLAAAVACFLAMEGKAQVRRGDDTEWGDAPSRVDAVGAFDFHAAIERARVSVWRESTLEDPYPNLRR
ncbi:hypothetical protein D7V93_26795 [Corallococcus llansteffanensis]|uniref:Uncharacterized protein n=1 Tax=Corallococcus llansteffanensis TaxID=2316731 RepID=A0A3A8PPC6_9BACT|nr:hypothetical protein D7V93_26795 [Corallococcus llansteffanensis]